MSYDLKIGFHVGLALEQAVDSGVQTTVSFAVYIKLYYILTAGVSNLMLDAVRDGVYDAEVIGLAKSLL